MSSTQDIGRKLMPKYAEFALAFTGIQANLTKDDRDRGGRQEGVRVGQRVRGPRFRDLNFSAFRMSCNEGEWTWPDKSSRWTTP